ncbi:MAG: amidase [Thermoleophilia bacterium]|nr:amidase [Thermoleophilia bacterium]
MPNGDELGAFCSHDTVRAEPSGEGPLSNTDFAAKDVIGVAGHVCCAGNPDWLASHDPAPATAPSVRLLLEAGGTLVGKTRCDELTYSIAGRNAHYGTPVNTRAPGRLPGGSSSGSAAAVAGGLVEIALGTDTTGSIRTPAALCGLWGLRPTLGAIDTTGVVPLAPSFDTVGALTAGPELLRATNDLLLRPPAFAPAWKGAVLPDDAWSLADREVRDALEPGVTALRRALSVERTRFADESLEHWSEAVRVVQAHDVWAVHGEWVERVRPEFGPGVGQRMRAAREVTDEQSDRSRRLCEGFGRRVRELVRDDTVVVIPTCPTVPPRSETPEEQLGDWRSRVMQLTAAANVSGLPQLAVPAGEVGGLPASISLIGPENSEPALIDLAVSCGL